MGQSGNGIINANINQNIGLGPNISIGANSNYSVNGAESDALPGVKDTGKSCTNDVGFDFVRGEKSKRPSTTMENFKEYMRDKQEKAKEAGEDVATKEREAKEKAKEVSSSISAEELKQLEMMGIDVETANMTDLMGMVNTLRFNADSQETKELMAKIAVDKGKTDTMTMIGGQVSVGGTQVSNVSVGEVIASENSIQLSDTEAVYLLKNNMELSKENIYKAHYSGVKLSDDISDKIIADMESQITKVIEQSGLEVDEDSFGATKLLVNNDIPVTTDNLRKYMDMKPYMGQSLEETDIPEKMVAMTPEEISAKAIELYENVKNINPVKVYDMVASGKPATIAAAVKYPMPDLDVSQYTDAKAVTAMRQMEEIRLSMTSAMAGKLIKMDMNVDTRELSKVVSMLKNIENHMAKDAFYAAGIVPTEENVSMYQEVSSKVNAIGKAHAGIIATPLMGDAFTIEGLHRNITSATNIEATAMVGHINDSAVEAQKPVVSEAQMETVRRSYEAVGTAPRRDMGDSITKAFANVKDILNEMNIPVNYETERAVRILGYNQLEITQANINQIIDYDRQVNDMLNTFYPEAVIGMIKDGINPLDLPIDELNKKIRDRNYNQGVTEAKNFAAYLRDMEKQGELTPAERESYIGMYRVMEKLSKSGDREAGYLFANGSRLTVRNLITAMRSRKAAGVDVSIDDSFGMIQDVHVSGKKIDEQIGGAFDADIVPADASAIHPAKTIDQLTEDVERFMEENSVEITTLNIRAVNVMLNQSGGLYSLVSELLNKMKFTTNTKEELIDKETENMADSMMGEDVPVEFTMESILESLRGSEEMSLRYEDLRANLTELMYQWGAAGTLSQMDIATIKTVNAGFNIMSGMAKQNKFQIPVATEQGTKVMNLTIKNNGDNSGLIEVSMASEQLGNIKAAIKCDEKGMLVGQIISDISQGNYALMESEGSIREALAEAGYASNAVNIGSAFTENLMMVKSIDSEKLYQVSVAVVKAMSVIW